MRVFLCVVFFVLCAFEMVCADDPSVSLEGVLDLTPDNFDTVVGKDQHVLVEFYAPWCGHCKSLVPEYAKLGKVVMDSGNKNIVIAKVDANAHNAIGSRFGVSGFPTIKFFKAGSLEPENYDGSRDAEGFMKYINGKVGTSLYIPKELSHVTVLTSSNFDSIVMDTSKDVLVEFYAPWCGHCKSLAPVYEKLGRAYANEGSVVIAKMDADDSSNRPVATKYDISGFPTLKWFPKDNKKGVDYSSGRDINGFVEFINKNANVNRKVNGDVSDDFGTTEALNAHAVAFIGGDEAARKAARDAVRADPDAAAQQYGKVMDRILKDGEGYVEKESKRLIGLLENKGINVKQLDNFQARLNVIRKFKKE